MPFFQGGSLCEICGQNVGNVGRRAVVMLCCNVDIHIFLCEICGQNVRNVGRRAVVFMFSEY